MEKDNIKKDPELSSPTLIPARIQEQENMEEEEAMKEHNRNQDPELSSSTLIPARIQSQGAERKVKLS